MKIAFFFNLLTEYFKRVQWKRQGFIFNRFWDVNVQTLPLMYVTVQKYGLNGLNGPFFKKEMALKDIFHSDHYINSSFGH